MKTFDMSDRFLKNTDRLETVIDGVFFILDPDKPAYYTLNEVGVKIWRFISSHAITFKAVCDYIEEEYGLEQSLCMEHASVFLESMVVKNVLHVEKLSSDIIL